MPVYQQFYTVLLQAYRAKYLLQRARQTRSHKIGGSVQLVYKLQHRLTWFVDVLRCYYTETVVVFTNREMESTMEKAEDIDQMAEIHVKYVAKLQERALLSTDLKPIHKAVVEMLDLSVLFARTVTDLGDKKLGQSRSAAPRRKSSAPLLAAAESSDSEDHVEEGEEVSTKGASLQTASGNPRELLQVVDKEFARLLPFITAGLRSVGRVGAEPMWEQLAELLEWEGKKDRY